MNSFSSLRIASLRLANIKQAPPKFHCATPENTSHLSDEVLLGARTSDDQGALSELFKRYARLIRAIGCQILRDRSEADDLVQDVFLYLHRKRSLFNASKGSARSWILQVGYTQALLRRRHLKSHGFYDCGAAGNGPEAERAVWIDPHYDQTVEGLFGRNGWKKVVEELTGDQRETLRLHFFEGYTFTEIAEQLGQSYANVRNHHYRGLEKLRRHLAEDELNRR
jgi:RNA polymerase sigma-70 factor (ECF subfamily)